MYHLKTQQERTKCVRECLRVLKKGGIFALAYINKLFIAIMFVKHNKESYLNEEFLEKLLDEGVVEKEDCDPFLSNSYFFLPSEMEIFMDGFNIDKVEHIATDGIGIFMGDMVNGFSDEEYEVWLK